MKHPHTKLLLYASDELNEREQSAIEKHLDLCEPCRAELAELDELGQDIRSLAKTPAPRDFFSAALQHAEGKKQSVSQWAMKGSRLAFACLALFILALVIRYSPLLMPSTQTTLTPRQATVALVRARREAKNLAESLYPRRTPPAMAEEPFQDLRTRLDTLKARYMRDVADG